MREVSIDQLITAERNVVLDRADTYLVSYPEFVRYFQELGVIDGHRLIIGAHVVYGWMPTVLHLKSGDFEGVARLVNAVKEGRRLHKDELTTVQQLINNSIVGTSKLLHFTNPYLYPIWDSRICAYVNAKAHTVNRVETYLEYVQNCDELVQDERFADVHRSVEEKLGYTISPFRAVELVMFASAKSGS